jgi:O-methyltransferase
MEFAGFCKRTIQTIARSPMLAGAGRRLMGYLENFLLFKHDPDRVGALRLIGKVRKQRTILLHVDEAFQLISLVRRSAKIPGVLAEVGVFQGASAKLICEAKDSRELYLFDTFKGLPDTGAQDAKVFRKGKYAASLSSVQEYLDSYPNVQFCPGLFPDSALGLEHLRFSLVHLDVDLYESTRRSLEFLYPRLSPGGILLSHDYSSEPGVRKAFDAFFADKPETVIELSTSQCVVVRLG